MRRGSSPFILTIHYSLPFGRMPARADGTKFIDILKLTARFNFAFSEAEEETKKIRIKTRK